MGKSNIHEMFLTLAKQLKTKRQTLNIGVRESAKQIGVSPATYSRMENAKPMTLDTYLKAKKWCDPDYK
jgi:transcriptional regulator with XRE-family HTH domain